MSVLRDLWLWLWKLLPANPILVRVVCAGGKRKKHLMARAVYLIILLIVMIIGQSLFSDAGSDSLADLAKRSSWVFLIVSIAQLLMMSFVAPIFTAGAITQEKDSNTFNILLTTPLSDAQIVLGSLMSRLYFVWVLLLSGLPIFCITMLFGGVTTAEVLVSFTLAACTALFTGSLAIAISVLKVGTQRTIFSFFLGIALYLAGVGALSRWPATWVAEAPPGTIFNGMCMSWLAPVHPFLALFVATGQTPAPDPASVRHYGWPWSWFLASPHSGYIVLTTLGSTALILVSLLAVRKPARTAEETWYERLAAKLTRKDRVATTRKPRRVWHNPIAWREAATRGSAAGRSALRVACAVLGIAGGVALLIAYENGWKGMTVDTVRSALTALVWIELTIILLVVTNTAAATLTRERDSGTMDLLLATPLTSSYLIAGMCRGLVSFVIPLIAVPTLTILMFVVADLFRTDDTRRVTTFEAVLLAPVLIISFSAAAAMIGLNRSLNSRKTVQAIMTSTAIVLLTSGILFGCVLGISQGGAEVASVFTPLSPFHAMYTLIDFAGACDLDSTTQQPARLYQARLLRGIMSVVSSGLYAGFVVAMYRHLVRGFDMTVRRQSA